MTLYAESTRSHVLLVVGAVLALVVGIVVRSGFFWGLGLGFLIGAAIAMLGRRPRRSASPDAPTSDRGGGTA
jgi:predicted cobalt transporter CbtA